MIILCNTCTFVLCNGILYTSSLFVGFPFNLLRNGIVLDTTTPLVCTFSSTNTIGNPKVSQIYGFITSLL